MEKKDLLKASFDDMVFEGRNKKYGAYELRKNYTKRLIKAFLITAFLPISFYSFSLIKKTEKPKDEIFENKKIIITKYNNPPKDIPAPEPPKKEPVIETPKQTVDFVSPKVVDKADEISTIEKIKISVISDIDKNGKEVSENPPPKQPELPISEPKIPEPPKRTDLPEISTSVDIQAKYNGDWSKYLINKMESLLDEDNSQNGIVVIRFVVDIDGSISEVKAISGPLGLRQIAEKAILSSGKWIPAEIQGKPVKAYRTQPIRFVANES